MNWLLDWIDRVTGWITAGILSIAFVLMVLSVVARYVITGWSFDWILEVVVFLVVWAVLLGITRIERRAGHIRVDFLFDAFSPRFQKLAELLALSLGLIVAVFFVYAGILVVQEAMVWDERTDSTLRIPLWIYYSALSTSFSLHVIVILKRMHDVWTGRRVHPAGHLAD